MATPPLTIGVEEEFLLLDPGTGQNVPVADAVRAALPPEVSARSHAEFRHSMIEMVTPVCGDLPGLAHELTTARRAAAAAAEATGAMLVPIGATPVGEPKLGVTDNPRYRAIADYYGPIVDDPAVCGVHVHVGVPDRETAVRVGNHLRVWLPVIQAMTVNSPFHAGTDTGHASWRAMQLDRWPALGPAPWFASAADFDRTVALLVGSGMMLDEKLVLWHARPSATYPTIEVRVADVPLTVDDTVLLTALVRGLVATALDDLADGRDAPRVPGLAVEAAHWNAAHAGLDGTLTDLRENRPRPAWELVGDLVTTVRPALERHGDLPYTTDQLDRLRAEGTGARRQREAVRRAGSLPAALGRLARAMSA
ncbi:glutamate--cysteine ligase [Actinoplanes sp. DH11]|uniref:carboxylate-amine ligase n=1 Tax=Actinoplanes sp. DH11 TaxID=2857011 RepID=UPI001E42171A|nr:glutamate--cysteine ligase [Actinoplanes sp. DH11]